MTHTISFDARKSLIQANQNISDVAKRTSNPEKLSLVVKIAKLVRYIGSTSEHLLNNLRGRPAVGVLKLMTLGLLPLTVYKLASGIFSVAKSSINEKIDALLGFIDSAGSLAEITAKTAEGLSAIGKVAANAVAWAAPLTIASAVLQSCGMILTAKSLSETHRFSIIFTQSAALDKTDLEYSLDDYKTAKQLIITNQTKEKSFVAKHFNADSKKMFVRLQEIEDLAVQLISSANPQFQLEGKQKLKITMQMLSDRLTSKKWSNSLSLLAGAVGNIGFAVVFSPCPAAGFILSAISGAVSLANFFRDKYRTIQFEKAIGIH
ncbi:MAG TPA: hypothetical protein VGP47_00545 [Parachlamydiaceae bacterium]|nr:hypothetical protein [Parachlamydiaceae bacterium]